MSADIRLIRNSAAAGTDPEERTAPSFSYEALIEYRGLVCGLFRAVQDGETVRLSLHFDESSSYDGRHQAVCGVTHMIMVRFHPKRIIADTENRMVRRALAGCLYFDKGRRMMRITEPWRRMIRDSAFDDEGYLINQGMLKSLPFGAFDSAGRGCGWIAAWNLMKLYGREAFMQETAEELSRRAILKEAFGVPLLRLYFYLRKKGLPVHLASGCLKELSEAMESSRMGILLYFHHSGAHYCAFNKAERGKIHFYNARYGMRSDLCTPEEFMHQRAAVPYGFLIVI